MWAVLLAASGSVLTSAWHIQIANGNDDLQMWRVAANILKEQF
jgi:hypothetical protein